MAVFHQRTGRLQESSILRLKHNQCQYSAEERQLPRRQRLHDGVEVGCIGSNNSIIST